MESIMICNREKEPAVKALPAFNQDRLSRREAAEYLGLKVSTLAADVTTKRLGLPYFKVGSRVYYRRTELDQFIENCKVNKQ